MTSNGRNGDDLNAQAHVSSEASKVPNQNGPPQPQQNGSALPQQMHGLAADNVAGGRGRGVIFGRLFSPETEMIKARNFIQERIYNILLQRRGQHPPLTDHEKRKLKDIAERFEVDLFRLAMAKEEYLNLDTLETRLHGLLRRFQVNNHMSIGGKSVMFLDSLDT